MDRIKIANRLKQLRQDAKLTPDAVCNAVGISNSALGMYESGLRIPRDEIKIKLANLYKTSVESLFFS